MAGRLAENIMMFCRLLRAAGLPVGPGHMLKAVEAATVVGMTNRDDFYWALVACLVTKRTQQPIFDQAFHLFWRNPRLMEAAMRLMLPTLTAEQAPEGTPIATRLAEALAAARDRPEADEEREEKVEVDATLTVSDREMLQTRDFEQMTQAEFDQARRLIQRLALAFPPRRTRRFKPDPAGHRPDFRATMRASMRSGGLLSLRHRSPEARPAPLVILCDISGSMGRYSRILLHFIHALSNDRNRVSSFLFGTRLTNITRALRHRDVDVAVAEASAQVTDWSGGTRIGQCLAGFNRDWSRRVLGQGAIVLFISDGLDRDAGEGLGQEVERLAKSCSRLIWLNPLLRYEGFAPRSLGIRAILPHVDELRPVHNLQSLADLAEALARPAVRRGAPLRLDPPKAA